MVGTTQSDHVVYDVYYVQAACDINLGKERFVIYSEVWV